ncbi:hypothetical protein [Agrobacterium sp. NPDC090273]|uniref:hypothetical protein n=1 Tax=Agrobacterium sp. NPDC090273 TaxID=3363919 RepID=UPI00383B7969
MLNIDTSHPLYRPIWVRLLIVGFCAAWAVVEFVNREFFWGTVVGGIAVYAGYVLLVAFKPGPAADEIKTNEEPADKISDKDETA